MMDGAFSVSFPFLLALDQPYAHVKITRSSQNE